MKKVMILLMFFSLAAVAGEGHKHKKDGWVEELGLTEAQAKEMKAVKKEMHKKLMAYKEELAAEKDAKFGQILNDDQMAKLKEMRKKHEKHMAEKKHKKYKKKKKHKKDKAE